RTATDALGGEVAVDRVALLVETVDEVEAAFPGLQAAFVDALDQIGLLVDKDFFGLSFDLFVDVLVVAFVLVQD
ncbi:hypothetical protein B8W95_13900, partial [Staphylococcus pasteuri]